MKPLKLLIANRGEVAIRIARAAAELGMSTVSIFSEDDSLSKHRFFTEESFPLSETGPKAYLRGEEILRIAKESGCDLLHPGYGFLSESAGFASLCKSSGIGFVGPSPEILETLGDKVQALTLAEKLGVPTLPGKREPISASQAIDFFQANGPMVIKALAGGGGRGIRIVKELAELEASFSICEREALAAFGRGDLYVEKFLPKARHIEVQILGDGSGEIIHLWERDCSLQRKNQKVVEVSPAPFLKEDLRKKIIDAALELAKSVRYKSLGTFEFLLDVSNSDPFYFMECNPRLQVEHTVTEEVTGLDLVQLQLRIEAGSSLSELKLKQSNIPPPNGYALQIRLNSETVSPEGEFKASSGKISVFEPASGPGIRVDSSAYSGYSIEPIFDSLLAKLIVRSSGDWKGLVSKAYRALNEFRIEGLPTNRDFLLGLLVQKELENYEIHTRFLDETVSSIAGSKLSHRNYGFELEGSEKESRPIEEGPVTPDGFLAYRSPMTGRLLELLAFPGESLLKGQEFAVLTSMKMEHSLSLDTGSLVHSVLAEAGQNVVEGQVLFFYRPEKTGELNFEEESSDPNRIRPDLSELIHRLGQNEDDARTQARSKRHKRGQRTIRENIADLCDPDSFIEYGALALAAQRRRRSLEELIKMSPADGLVAGLGSINGTLFDRDKSRSAILGYDYTVFMGTQGAMNHKKTDRFLQVVEREKLPLVFFTEGGGGRPGEVDVPAVAGLDLHTFRQYAGLIGGAPRIAIASGRCFAGNAALFGASDIRIATSDSNIGMGGPVMVKGGGLGNFSAEEIGPSSEQAANGVVDILVSDEKEAVRTAKQCLAYFQGNLAEFGFVDQKLLRGAVPENRVRTYDIRELIGILADTDSVQELQKQFAPGMWTGFVRVGGRPIGILANDCRHLGGAIDADSAAKAAKFVRLCDLFRLPILFLCDTPGFMVGPDAEKKGLVRKAAELFEAGASITVPSFTIVLRKGYGLGAMAMAGGSFHAPVFTISWPSGEFGAMGIEGEIRIGFQKELAEIQDWEKRKEMFDRLVREAYERGKAINMASYLEIDAVIDPSESRNWILRGLDSVRRR